jgi:hypothetical protein
LAIVKGNLLREVVNMAREVGFTLRTTRATGFSAVLDALLGGGWKLRDIKGVSFLEEDDLDGSSWRVFDLSVTRREVLEIVRRRDDHDLPGGVVLLFGDEEIGGNFLWTGQRTLIVSPTVNRKLLPSGWSDVNWYLDRLVAPLEFSGFRLESIEFHER